MTKVGRAGGALGCMAIFTVFAAVCWLESMHGVSFLLLALGVCFMLIFTFASEDTIKLIGSWWV